MTISLVATVRNEYGSLPDWLEGLREQTRRPAECVIVDGGSTDGTVERLRSADLPFPCRVISAPQANISTGRNIAIGASSGEIIVVTDAGTRADPRWLQRLVGPLERRPGLDIVAGFFEPEASTHWTKTLAATTLPDAFEIGERNFLASSRSVAFRRRWFDAGFQYPEWLDYCEDLVFDLQLRRAGAVQVTQLDAVVRFSPRRDLASFARQYYRYARGDGKAGLFWHRHLIRYGTYLTAAIVSWRRRPVELILLAIAGSLYLRKPVIRHRRRNREEWRNPSNVATTMALIATQRLVGDLAKMAGYPAGLLWRWRRDRSARYWKSGWRSRRPDGSLPPV